jgi:ABC-type polysaccharide/polyol phosphate transport system ATPase subunit
VKPAIQFSNVTLWRRTQEEFAYDLKGSLFRLLQPGRKPRASRRRTIHAVDFTIAHGEKVALIGANGSGKSTLLKLAAGIIRPTEGSVAIDGTLAALIELGGGLDGDLTLVENIVFYGVLLGFSRAHMKERIPDILRFAELEDYANAPLKTLSSGMSARLSFAIATDVRPEILLIDEVLSVGDESFRHKSSARIQRFWDAKSTIVLVSHDLPFIANNCDRAIFIADGEIVADGPAKTVIDGYLATVASSERAGRFGPAFPVDGTAAFGHLDDVRADGLRLTVRGWALLESRRPGSALAVFLDGQHVGNAVYGLERHDVATIFSASDAHVGFDATFSLPELAPGDHRVECALLDDASGYYRPIEHTRFVRAAFARETATA